MAEDRAQNAHAHFSVDCFNRCWELIDKAHRTADEKEEMLLLAQASLWHWKQRTDCKPLNMSIGYWQASRVFALAEKREMASFYAERCLEVSQSAELAPFYLGYAYEALARAALAGGAVERAAEYLAKAKSELRRVDDKDELKMLQDDIDSLDKAF